jgi:hypothetical protein
MKKHKKTKPLSPSKPLHEPKPDAAGIDLGATEIWVAVAPDRCEMPVRRFGAFTEDLMAIVQWLLACGFAPSPWKRPASIGFRSTSFWLMRRLPSV